MRRQKSVTGTTYPEAVAWLYHRKNYTLVQILLQRLITEHRKPVSYSNYTLSLMLVGAHIQLWCLGSARGPPMFPWHEVPFAGTQPRQNPQRDVFLYKLNDAIISNQDFVYVDGNVGTVLYEPTEFTSLRLKAWHHPAIPMPPKPRRSPRLQKQQKRREGY